MTIKIGIIGYGVVGKTRHKALKKHPSFEVIAVSDINLDFNSAYLDGIHTFTDYKDLIKHEGIDGIFISLPNQLAAEATLNGLKKGLHVFCEKPPARKLSELRPIAEFLKINKNLKLMYGFNHRYHESVQDALKMINSKKLGDIINIRGVYGKSNLITFNQLDWRTKREIAGGGVLLDQGIHMLDLIRLFAGEFKEVKSYVSNSQWNHDVEDNAFAIMRSKNGVICSIHSTATQWQHKFNMEITFSNGTIILEGILSGTKTYGKETLKIFPGAKPYLYKGKTAKTKKFYFDKDTSWSDEIDEFAEVINKNIKVKYGNIYDSLDVMIMIDKIYKNDKRINNVSNK